MNTHLISDELIQLSLDYLAGTGSTQVSSQKKRKVEETLVKIRKLHDELNDQLENHPSQRPVIHSPADAAHILECFIGALDHEELWVIVLDTRNKVKRLVALYKGTVNASQVRISEVFREAILENAPSIIVAHNHPSSDVTPSPEDISVTRNIVQAGKILDISVLDHIIVGGSSFTSLKEKGLGFS